jgi:glycolate oxidase FAD binding subunit
MPCDLVTLQGRAGAVVGAEHVFGGAAAAAFAVDGVAPRLVARPGTQEEVRAVVAAAAEAGAAVAPRGTGAALGLGNPPARLDLVVCLERLDRIVEFDPANLVVTAEAGLRLEALQARLAGERQFLPLDPPAPEGRSVGGVLATNASGPSRLAYGTLRDLTLGLRLALASGEAIRCGGMVIKNVSGYDMNKLFIGSLGTLGIITEATFRLLPEPAVRASVVGVCPSLAQAQAVVTAALQSFLLPEAIELLDRRTLGGLAGRLGLAAAEGHGLVVAVAGSQETVERQVRDLQRLMTEAGAAASPRRGTAAAAAGAAAVRDAAATAVAGDARVVVKAAVPISHTCALFASAEALAARHGWPAAVSAHAGSGVVRAAYLPAGSPPEAVRDGLHALRHEAEAVEGSLVVEAAPPVLKAGLDVWGKAGDAFPVLRRLKAEFDPRGVLNPGRFVGGI